MFSPVETVKTFLLFALFVKKEFPNSFVNKNTNIVSYTEVTKKKVRKNTCCITVIVGNR